MRFLSWIIIILFANPMFAGNEEKHAPSIMDFDDFQHYLKLENDTVYVINFWATWCSPCVNELPEFERLNQVYSDEKFKMLLVSLDFYNAYETRLIPFLKEKNILAEVVLLHEPDANAWINKVDSSWTGAIPATLIYKNDFRQFREGTYTFQELNQIVQPLINP